MLVAVGEQTRGVPAEDVLRQQPRVERRFVGVDPAALKRRRAAATSALIAVGIVPDRRMRPAAQETAVASFSFSDW